MSKKVPPKGKYKLTGAAMSLMQKPGKRAAPAKKAGRHTTADKATSCFDGAGDLNPAKTKVGQPKKR
jgi:hypothetical protein